MAKLFKWLAGLVGALLLLLVVAVVVLPMVIDPNDHKETLQQLVKEQTGRDLVIRERLELSVFPTLGVTTGGVTLSNAAGFGKEPFAQVEALDLRIKLMPLFSRRLEVDALELNGLVLNLAKDKSGRSNWDDLVKPAPEKAKAPAEEAKAGSAFAFNLSGVQVDQARLVWDDRQRGERYELKDVSLTTGALAPGSTVPVAMSFALSSGKPPMQLKLKLKSTLGISADLKRMELPDLVLELAARGEGLPDDGLELRLAAAAVLDQTEDSLSVKHLKLEGAGVALSGSLAGKQLSSKPSFLGDIKLAETNPRKLMALFGGAPETTDPNVLTRLSGQLALQATASSLSLKPLTVKLDDSSLSGNFSMPSFKGPALRFALNVDSIDLDRYLPPAKEESAPATSAAQPATDDPLAGLRSLDLDGRFTIGQLKLNNLNMQKVEVKLHARNGVLKVDPASADLYQGRFDGQVTVDARKKTPTIHAVKKLSGVQIGPLLKDLADSDRLTGTGEFKADLKLAGLSEAEVRKSLNGNLSFAFTDGAVKGINIAQSIRSAKSGLGGGTVESSGAQQTDFSSITGSATVRNGLVENKDLQAMSPLLRVKGEGKVDLPADSLDYVVTATLVKSLEGQGGRGADELAGLPIPVRFTGPLTKPEYSIDFRSLLGAAAKQRVKEQLQQRLAPTQEDGGGGKLKDRLKGLLNR